MLIQFFVSQLNTMVSSRLSIKPLISKRQTCKIESEPSEKPASSSEMLSKSQSANQLRKIKAEPSEEPACKPETLSTIPHVKKPCKIKSEPLSGEPARKSEIKSEILSGDPSCKASETLPGTIKEKETRSKEPSREPSKKKKCGQSIREASCKAMASKEPSKKKMRSDPREWICPYCNEKYKSGGEADHLAIQHGIVTLDPPGRRGKSSETGGTGGMDMGSSVMQGILERIRAKERRNEKK